MYHNQGFFSIITFYDQISIVSLPLTLSLFPDMNATYTTSVVISTNNCGYI